MAIFMYYSQVTIDKNRFIIKEKRILKKFIPLYDYHKKQDVRLILHYLMQRAR